MRILITGGTGYIGRHLSKYLVAAGHAVIILSRNLQQVGPPTGGTQMVQWDGKSAAGWGHLAGQVEAIVNLAGADLAGAGFFPARWTAERKRLLVESRVNAGAAIMEAVRGSAQKPQSILQISGIGYYGSTGDRMLTEEDPAGDDFLARLTVAWEASTAEASDLGVRQVILRTAVLLDPHMGALRRLIFPFRVFAGGPMGSGTQWFPWIHPSDAIAAIRFLLESESAAGAFNVIAPVSTTNAEFGKALARVLGRPYWMPVPGFALRLALGEVASTVLTGQRAQPKRLSEMGFRFRFPDAESALRDILRMEQRITS